MEGESYLANCGVVVLCVLGGSRTVGGAAAFALAGVFALASLVAGLAAALTLAVVFALTGVLGGIVGDVAQASLDSFGRTDLGGGRLGGRLGRYGGSADQAGESCRQKQCIQWVLHEYFDLAWLRREGLARVGYSGRGYQDHPAPIMSHIKRVEHGKKVTTELCKRKNIYEGKLAVRRSRDCVLRPVMIPK